VGVSRDVTLFFREHSIQRRTSICGLTKIRVALSSHKLQGAGGQRQLDCISVGLAKTLLLAQMAAISGMFFEQCQLRCFTHIRRSLKSVALVITWLPVHRY